MYSSLVKLLLVPHVYPQLTINNDYWYNYIYCIGYVYSTHCIWYDRFHVKWAIYWYRKHGTYYEPYPLNHTPLLVEMLVAGRLPLNCCKAVTILLSDCCYGLQHVATTHALRSVTYRSPIWGSLQGLFWGRFEGRSRPLPSLPTRSH